MPLSDRTSEKVRNRIRELALEAATANGVFRVECFRGRAYEEAQGDYQDAVRKLDAFMSGYLYTPITIDTKE